MTRDINYEENNKKYCNINEILGIKCKNYKLCKGIIPKWWYECKGNYLCTNCHMMFGTWGETNIGKGELDFENNLECPICLEKKICVSYPRCNHKICISCFKKCMYNNNEEFLYKCCLCRNKYYIKKLSNCKIFTVSLLSYFLIYNIKYEY